MGAVINRTPVSAEGVAAWRAHALSAPLVSARILDAALALGVFAVSFAVYNATLAPGLTYVSLDGNEGRCPSMGLRTRRAILHVGRQALHSPRRRCGLLHDPDASHQRRGACVLLYAVASLLTKSRPRPCSPPCCFRSRQSPGRAVKESTRQRFAGAHALFLAWGERLTWWASG
jgi:hypothetical protein